MVVMYQIGTCSEAMMIGDFLMTDGSEGFLRKGEQVPMGQMVISGPHTEITITVNVAFSQSDGHICSCGG